MDGIRYSWLMGGAMGNSSFTRHDLTVNGLRTAVLEIGSGAPLVFLHGTGTFPGFDMARQWANERRVIIPFHPGFGASDDAPGYARIEDYVLHYLDLFDQMELDRFDLAGFSLGGWIAAEIALYQPNRIRRLVLVAPSGLDVPEAPTPDLFALPPQEIPSYLAHDPAKIMHHFPREADPAFEAALGREMQGYGRLLGDEPQGHPVLARWLHRISMPVLLLWGAEDRLRPTGQAQAWQEALPDARTELVPRTGHLLFEETPEAARIVTRFLVGS